MNHIRTWICCLATIAIVRIAGCGSSSESVNPTADQAAKIEPTRSAQEQEQSTISGTTPTSPTQDNFQGRGERYAIMIGVRQYPKSSGLRPLSFTENDVSRLNKVLHASGYRQENLVVMTDSQGKGDPRMLPERNKVRRQLASILRDRSPSDSVIVAFAGHGVQFEGDEDSYFCPLDGEVDNRDTLISLGEVYSQLKLCQAGFKLVLCDACRDDPLTSTTRGLSLIKNEVQRPLLAPPGGVAVFYSCSPGESAFEDPELKHGVFFNFVINGLLGDADLDDDDQVTLPELEYHAKRRVSDFVRSEYSGRRQMPNLKGDTRGLVALVDVSQLPPDEDLATSDSLPAQDDQVVDKPDVNEAIKTPLPDGPMGLVTMMSQGSETIGHLAISPDGKRIATATDGGTNIDRQIRLWDIKERKLIKKFPSNNSLCAGLAFSPDGKSLLSLYHSSPKPIVQIWDIESGEATRTIESGPQFPMYFRSATFRTNGSIFGITEGRTHTLTTLNLETMLPDQIDFSARSVFFALSKDEKRVALSYDHKVNVWSLESRSLVRQFDLHNAWRTAISTDGKIVAATNREYPKRSIGAWNVESGDLVNGIQFDTKPQNRYPLVMTSDASLLIFNAESQIGVYDLKTRGNTVFTGHKGSVNALALTPDGRFLMSGGDDAEIRVWRLPKPGVLQPSRDPSERTASRPPIEMPKAPPPKPRPATPQPPTPRLSARLIGQPKYYEGHSKPVWKSVFSPDGKRIASTGDDRTVRVWDVEQQEAIHVLGPWPKMVGAIEISHDGTQVSAAVADGEWLVWDVESGKVLHTINTTSEKFLAHDLSFSRSGKRLVCCDAYGTVLVYDLVDKQIVSEINLGRLNVRLIEFLPDEIHVLIGSTHPATLELWNTETRKMVRSYEVTDAPKGSVSLVMGVRPDGKEVALGVSTSKTLRWNVDTGDPLEPLRTDGRLLDLAYCPVDGYLFAYSDNGGMLYDMEQAKPVVRFPRFTRSIQGVWMSKDGQRVQLSGQSVQGGQHILGITKFVLPSDLSR